MNTSAAGVVQCAATTGDRPTTATTCVLEPGVVDRARGRTAACPSAPIAGVDDRRVVVLPARPGSPPTRGGGRRRTPRCRPRAAAAPSQIVERPQYEPISTNGAPGTAGGRGERGGVQRVALVGRHEPLGRQRVRRQSLGHASQRYGSAAARRHASMAPMQAALDDLVDAARPRADRGQHLPRALARREPPAGVRRPGRRPGARRRGPHGRRAATASCTRCTPTSCAPATRRCRSSTRSTASATAAASPPAASSPSSTAGRSSTCRRASTSHEPGPDHQLTMPDGLPDPESLPDWHDAHGAVQGPARRAGTTGRARSTCATSTATRSAARAPPSDGQRVWLRADGDAARRSRRCTPASSPTPAT